MGRLSGKSAIITGAASGLGRVSANLFAKEGASVAVVDLDEKNGLEVVEEIKAAGGTAIFIKTDITKQEDCENMVKTTVDTFGKLDVLYCNAGITGALNPDIVHIEESMFDKILEINLKGTWRCIRAAVPSMVKNGGGSIVCTASVAGMRGCAGSSGYSTSKAAIINLCQTVSYETCMHGIRCNSVSPFTMATPLMDFMLKGENGAQMMELFGRDNITHKLIQPIEVANAALFLASDESTGIYGQNIVVDGGMTIKGFSYIPEEFAAANPYEK